MVKTSANKHTEALFNGARVRRFVNMEGTARANWNISARPVRWKIFGCPRATALRHSRAIARDSTASA